MFEWFGFKLYIQNIVCNYYLKLHLIQTTSTIFKFSFIDTNILHIYIYIQKEHMNINGNSYQSTDKNTVYWTLKQQIPVYEMKMNFISLCLNDFQNVMNWVFHHR